MWAAAILVLAVTLLCWVVLRRRHPKGYPPGPAGIPVLGYMPWLGPFSHIEIGKLGQKYGSVFSVQLGTYSYVVLNDFASVKAALKMDVFSGRPNHLLAMSLLKLGLSFNEGESWSEQRRFALRTLRDFGFGKKSMELGVMEEAADLVQYFRSQANQSIYVKNIFCISFINGLWTMVAGDKFSLHDPKPRKFYELGKAGFQDPEVSGPLYVLPWLARWFPGMTGFGKVEESAMELKAILLDLVEEQERTFVPGQHRGYIDVYLEKMREMDDPRSSFYKKTGRENLVDSLVALFMAGSDTLTCTLEYALLYLITFQEIQEKAQAEIERVVGRERVPQSTDRPKLPYVEAFMAETMRHSSILAGSVVHSTTEDTEFGGFFLPKGTIVMPNLYQVHHSEEYWGDPEAFRPDRFLDEEGCFRKDEHLIPFSLGKRTCIAENIAMTEFFFFITNLLQAFHLKPDPLHPLPGLYARKSAFCLSPNPYKIIFKERH